MNDCSIKPIFIGAENFKNIKKFITMRKKNSEKSELEYNKKLIKTKFKLKLDWYLFQMKIKALF
jgi:hypothetical protein